MMQCAQDEPHSRTFKIDRVDAVSVRMCAAAGAADWAQPAAEVALLTHKPGQDPLACRGDLVQAFLVQLNEVR